MAHNPAPPMIRFISKVQRTDTCWLWTGGRKRRTLDGNGGPDLDFGCLGRLALLVTILAAGVGLRLWCDALWRTCPAVAVALTVGAVVVVAAWAAKRMGVRR